MIAHGALLTAVVSVLLPHCTWGQDQPDILWETNAHSRVVRAVSFSAGGSALASGGNDATVRVWAVSRVTELASFTVDQDHVLSVAVSSDASLVAAGGDSGKSRLWRIADGERLWIGGPNNEVVHSLVFSPDGSLLGIGRTDGINVRNALTGGGIPFSEPEGTVFSVAFSPDGTTLASGNANDAASLWRVPEGTLIRDLIGHTRDVVSVDFSPDGKLLATASADGTARLWNVTDGATSLIITNGGGSSAKFSADGRMLVTVDEGVIRFWRVTDGSLLHTYAGTGAGPLAVASNGKYFAYGTQNGSLVLARMPVVITETQRVAGATIVCWQGGTGWYQLQMRTNLAAGTWQDLGGPTMNLCATNNLVSTNTFFRVLSLPNP